MDTVAARARYGRWIGGVLPELVPFPKTGRARGGSSKAVAATAQEQLQEGVEGSDIAQDGSGKHWVHLRRLRWMPFCAFLAGCASCCVMHASQLSAWLAGLAHLHAVPASCLWRRHPLLLGEHLLAQEQLEREQRRGSATARRLPGRRNVVRADEQADAQLPPNPQPIDVAVRPQTRAVIITGKPRS